MAVQRGQEEQEQEESRSPASPAEPAARRRRRIRRTAGQARAAAGRRGRPYPPVSLWNSRERIADVVDAHDPAALEPGEHPELRHEIAGRLVARREHGKTAFLDVRDLSGTIQVVVRVDAVGQEEYDRVLNLDIGDIVGVKGVVYVTQRGQLALAVKECHAADQDAAPAPGPPPRARRHRHPLPLPGARPARQRGHPRAVHHAREDRRGDPGLAQRTPLRGNRNAGPAVARRGRRVTSVHHPPQRPEPRPVPADLGRAVPQPLHRRRHGERLRHGQGVPQRGHLSEAQPGVHDHRVHAGLCRLLRRGHRDRRNVPRRRPACARPHDGPAQRRNDRPRQALAAGHDARADPRALGDRLHGVRRQAARRGARRAGRPAGHLGGAGGRHLHQAHRAHHQPAHPRVRLPAGAVPDHQAATPSTRSWPSTSTRSSAASSWSAETPS